MKKVLLLILDGVGVNKKYAGNAFELAKKPTLDKLFSKNPRIDLYASEEPVGLFKSQIGGSEVGHTTIGAGKVVTSDLLRISKSIKNKQFFKNKTLTTVFSKKKSDLHLIGLLSDGGIHSHISHLFALLELSKKHNKKVYLHVISDGRDVPPKSLFSYLTKLNEFIYSKKIENLIDISSISGRFYSMDRDKKWERTQKAYNMLVDGKAMLLSKSGFIKENYKKGITDEFLPPTLFTQQALIKDNDDVLFFNFRSDRARALTKAFIEPRFKEFKRKKVKINFYSLTEFDKNFRNIKIVFPPLKNTKGLGKVISDLGYKQLRAAESEKYPHVTYFFNQGTEVPFKGEQRIVVPSPKVKTYDLKPEMSLPLLLKKIIPELKKDYKLMVVNFANGDMVGHTGNIQAAVKAVESMDLGVSKILKGIDKQTVLIITSDHGNCDEMVYADNSISTAHSLNKVAFVVVGDYSLKKDIKNASLANIAPTILDILDIKKPKDMKPSLLKK